MAGTHLHPYHEMLIAERLNPTLRPVVATSHAATKETRHDIASLPRAIADFFDTLFHRSPAAACCSAPCA